MDWFNPEKGYGFIQAEKDTDDGKPPQEVFVEYSAIDPNDDKTLEGSEEVKIKDGVKGIQPASVKKTKEV